MELTLPRASLSLVVLILVVCNFGAGVRGNYLAFPRMGRSDYIAFPRMGRSGYLAFPRMGRSQTAGNECCPKGLRSQFFIGQEGKEKVMYACEAPACCDGLREAVDESPEGFFSSWCIPDQDTKDRSSEVFSNLKNLLQK